MHLLILRPKGSADYIKQRLAELMHQVSHFPISKQQILDVENPQAPFSGIIFTSALAVKFYQKKIAAQPQVFEGCYQLPLYAVGDKTAQSAKDAGFENVLSAKGDGAALAALIIKHHPTKSAPLLYPCAQIRHFDMDAALSPHDIDLATWPIYQTHSEEALPQTLIEHLKNGEIDAVCHYSAASAKHFFYLLEKEAIIDHIGRIKHFALSQEVSRHIPSRFKDNVEIAALPNEASMLELIINSKIVSKEG